MSSQEEQLHMVDGEEDGSAILDRRVQAVERKRWGTDLWDGFGDTPCCWRKRGSGYLAPQLLYLRVLAGVLGAVIFVVSLLSYKKAKPGAEQEKAHENQMDAKAGKASVEQGEYPGRARAARYRL